MRLTRMCQFASAMLVLIVCSLHLEGKAFASEHEIDLQAELAAFLLEESLGGGVLLIDDLDEVITAAAGIANRQSGKRVKNDTRFYLASAGKPMVAAAILGAVTQDQIDLDAKALDYFPKPSNAAQLDGIGDVTIRQLLNHTSGLAEYLSDEYLSFTQANTSRKWNANSALSYAVGEPKVFAAGAAFEYTNTNYALLGEILAALDGSLSASLQKRVFDPAGMKTASVGAPANSADLARGYVKGKDVSALGWNSVLGDGPVVGTVQDMRAFAKALMDGRIMGGAQFSQMVTLSPGAQFYGLGMGVDADEFGRFYGHSGAYEGYEAEFRYYPGKGLFLAYAVNGNQQSEDNILDIAADWYFDQKNP
ncbi:MAG: serine hydrolase domain-containing protein [Pseudomonadota bacterium]